MWNMDKLILKDTLITLCLIIVLDMNQIKYQVKFGSTFST